jgi:HNH endonuclease
MSGRPTDPVARFWRKVNQRGTVVKPELGPCWQWLGVPHRGGYGRHSPGPGVMMYAHRYSYVLLVGPVPDGLQLDHLCRNRMCVRPDHLEPVTAKENVARGEAPTAIHGRKTSCDAGHPLTGDNLHVYTIRSSGTVGRRCRACGAERAREYRARRAVAA